MTPLTRTVLATIAYYDAIDFPLTLFEVWKHLSYEDTNMPAQYRIARSIGEVDEVLQVLVRDRSIKCVDGFYVMLGRGELVAERRRRMVISAHKLEQMQRAVRLLKWIPFVRMVWVTGRLAMKHAVESSDWDVLIVLEKNHIWTGRFLVTLATQLFGRRRTDKHHADHLCLNYFITTDSLSISLDDRYSAHEYMMARPMFSSVRPEKFLAANAWITRFRPHFDTLLGPSQYRVVDTAWSHRVRRAGEWLCRVLKVEQPLKKMQRAKIMRNPKTFAKGSMIIANDQELVFLPKPHSPRVMEAYHERCRAQGLRACA